MDSQQQRYLAPVSFLSVITYKIYQYCDLCAEHVQQVEPQCIIGYMYNIYRFNGIENSTVKMKYIYIR